MTPSNTGGTLKRNSGDEAENKDFALRVLRLCPCPSSVPRRRASSADNCFGEHFGCLATSIARPLHADCAKRRHRRCRAPLNVPRSSRRARNLSPSKLGIVPWKRRMRPRFPGWNVYSWLQTWPSCFPNRSQLFAQQILAHSTGMLFLAIHKNGNFNFVSIDLAGAVVEKLELKHPRFRRVMCVGYLETERTGRRRLSAQVGWNAKK